MPTKAYTFPMLVTRLTVGALIAVIAAMVATRVARDRGQAAWWLGGLFLAVSLPDHLVFVWNDYPPWYHAIYLSYLVPIAGATATIMGRRTSAS